MHPITITCNRRAAVEEEEEAAAEFINILSIWMKTTRSRQCMWWMHFDRFQSYNLFSSVSLCLSSPCLKQKKTVNFSPVDSGFGWPSNCLDWSLLWSAVQKGHGGGTLANRSPAVTFSAGFHLKGFSSNSCFVNDRLTNFIMLLLPKRDLHLDGGWWSANEMQCNDLSLHPLLGLHKLMRIFFVSLSPLC